MQGIRKTLIHWRPRDSLVAFWELANQVQEA
nr:MAG TPA: Histone-binding protein RBBP4, Polycomb protein, TRANSCRIPTION.9A [Caudoviricetes sp.]